jgi:hypothetical protein
MAKRLKILTALCGASRIMLRAVSSETQRLA